jgi:hypothetical protein
MFWHRCFSSTETRSQHKSLNVLLNIVVLCWFIECCSKKKRKKRRYRKKGRWIHKLDTEKTVQILPFLKHLSTESNNNANSRMGISRNLNVFGSKFNELKHKLINKMVLIVVFSVHFDKYKFFPFQQMHTLLKHKMLQFLYYTAPTCFGPRGPSSGSTYQNLTKVTISLKISVKTLC